MYKYRAKCVRVIDGDSIIVMLDLGFSTFRRETIRLFGVDTPEVFGVKKSSEEYKKGERASNRVKELLPEGKELEIETVKDKKGKFGRYLGKILIDGQDLGEILIAEGLATEKEY